MGGTLCPSSLGGGAGITCERAPVGGGVSGSTHTYGDLLFRFLPSYWSVNGKCVKKTCLIRTGSTVKSCIPDCKHSDYTMKALNNKTNQKKKVRESDIVVVTKEKHASDCWKEKSGEGMEQRGHVWLPKKLAL